MDDGQLVAQIEHRPAIWDTRDPGHGDVRRNRAAWRDVCRLAHPDFDRLTAEEKRDKCLALQKRWRDMRQAYHRRGVRRRSSSQSPSSPDPAIVAKLKFLDACTESIEIVDADGHNDRPPAPAPAAKRARNASDASTSSATPSPATSTEVPSSAPAPAAPAAAARAQASADDEDRHFLLSLVSYFREVPRRDRLALRRDMLALVARYVSGEERERPAAANSRT